MKLGESEPLRIFDQNAGCIRHIDSHLNDSGRDQNVNFVSSKRIHNGALFFGLHPSVQLCNPNGFRQDLPQIFRIFRDILHLLQAILLYRRTDDIGLSSFFKLLKEKAIDLSPV